MEQGQCEGTHGGRVLKVDGDLPPQVLGGEPPEVRVFYGELPEVRRRSERISRVDPLVERHRSLKQDFLLLLLYYRLHSVRVYGNWELTSILEITLTIVCR